MSGVATVGKSLQLLFLISSSIIIINCLSSSCSQEGDALLEVVRAWNADIPTSWVPGTGPCQANWSLVTCDLNDLSIVALNLSNIGLQGPVPAAISNLTSLQSLDISNIPDKEVKLNAVTGDLSALAPLQPNLQELYAGFNYLQVDKYPEVIYNLDNLVVLKTDNCLIPGPFPVALTKLTKLQVLWLGNNSFTGPVPSELGNMTSLRELAIWGSDYKSALPPELGNLGNLTYLDCQNCSLWGSLPSELGKLKNLQRLYLNTNTFTGPIPQEWQDLTSLYILDIQANYVFGTVEPWVLGLANLSQLFISYNQLQGPLPSIINNTNTRATGIWINCNYFTGEVPVFGPTIVDYLDSANCFDTTNENILSDTYCARQLNCQGFQQDVTQNGCPPCPDGQYLANSTLCICYEAASSSSSKKFPVGVIVGICIAVVVLVFALIVIFLLLRMWRKRTQHESRHDYFEDELSAHDILKWETPKGVQRYSFQDLANATDGFHNAREIGSGAFGKVFVGTFPDGKTLAIKRASTVAFSARSQKEFRNEVLLLSRLHHKNLVRLEGFCDDNRLQILVYEYMKNGNLHGHLFTRKGARYLDWYKRLEIAVQVARGLDYLHSFADPPVIHRDVKPSNILLDDNLDAKVSDFGISRETPEFITHVSTRLAGTAGYIDPQYFLRRQLTPASDVYSYGVVLLELVTGQKAIRKNEQGDELNLIQWATPRLEEGGIEAIVDAQLEGNYPKDIYLDMAQLAVRCAAFEKDFRPSMKAVLSILEPQLEASQPVRPIPSNDDVVLQAWSSTLPGNETTPNHSDGGPFSNETSITVLEPR
ncbi:unnamed protein product [Sphagnum jensenii]|uniref:Protein kinase domain-containing protein n=1 Tax=Sphagnum jensenii TaxID=128206 RepID=A0ABP0X676_9BRYO